MRKTTKTLAFVLSIGSLVSSSAILPDQIALAQNAVPAAEQPVAKEQGDDTEPKAAEETENAAAPVKVIGEKLKAQEAATEATTTPVDLDGQRVVLNFRDEEWLPALEWLAKELKLNLDWQSLPEGQLSLFSSKEYTLREAEDLINMQLLSRGFTLLKRGEVLRLVPMKNIDITLVPRVTPEELETLEKHQVVRVSIPLNWMVAEQAANEFKPLLSPYGQMFPLASSNRLEVLDAVVNLRELVRLLQRAESEDGRRVRVMEFQLKYRKAVEIAVQVRQLLGMAPDGTAAPSTQTQLDIEQAKFRAEAVKQLGNNARDLIVDKKVDTFLVVNEKENSIVVNGPPDKLEMVRQTIETLDKPLPPVDSSWQTVSRVKVHPVNGFDPETISRLLLALQERGNLAKDARIQHESAYNRIIAFASPEDQLTIAQLIESYRAEKRSAAVIPLNTVTPQYAAKAVQLILKNPDRPSTMPGVASDGKFQIEADPDNHRVLLWATADEVKEVREFLASLGESFDAIDTSSQMHVLNVGSRDLDEVTKRLKALWQDVSKSPLVIERKSDGETPSIKNERKGDGVSKAEATDIPDLIAQNESAGKNNVHLVARQNETPATAENTATAENSSAAAKSSAVENKQESTDTKAALPPVRIIEGQNGDVVIISRDPQAAGTAKRLIQQLKPQPGDVRIIQIKHAQAMSIRRQLEEMMQHTYVGSSTKLSTSMPMSIDVDSRTNRLIVQHCNAQQWQMLQEYIQVLDQPTTEDAKLVRTQTVYRVQHRRVTDVAEVVKEVYRDLLNFSDRSAYSSYRESGYRSMAYNKNMAATATNPEYQGLMSIGTDLEANLLIISAPKYLTDEIVKLAESVDTPSDGPAMAVVPANVDSSEVRMREALSKILKKR